MGVCDYQQPRFWPPKDQAMQELGMDNQNPIHGSGAIPGLADQGNPLVDLRSPLTPILAPDPSLHQGVLDPYDPRPWIEDSFAVNNRATTTIAATSRNPDPNAIYIVTSKSESLDQLESGLTKAGANTIQLDEGSTLTDLVARVKVLTPTGGFSAIHLLGHGSEGQFFVGKETLTSRNLWRYKAELKELGTLLTENGDLLVYGCETGKGTAGQRLIDGLAKYTRADVAASDDRTYSSLSSHRSDWELEIQSGNIEARSDVLTGLNWDGSLGENNNIKFSGSKLNIDATNATGVISIKAKDAEKLTIKGFGSEPFEQSISTGVRTITEIEIKSNKSGIHIGEINLDDNETDDLYPLAYKISTEAIGSYDAGLAGERSDGITLGGTIKTYGGSITIKNKGTVSINSSTINTYEKPLQNTGKAGNIDINPAINALDLPLAFWFPSSSTAVKINQSTLRVGSLNINSSAHIDPYLSYKGDDKALGNFVDKFMLDSVVDTASYGMQGMVLPAVVKAGAASSTVTISGSTIEANDTISLASEAAVNLESKSMAINSANLLNVASKKTTGIDLDGALAVTKADAGATIVISNSSLHGKKITASTEAINNLSSDAQVASNLAGSYTTEVDIDPNDPTKTITKNSPGTASGEKSGISSAIAVGNTNSTISIDSSSTLKAVNKLSLKTNATPSLTANASTSIWGDGFVTVSNAFEVDKTNSTINMDGTLTITEPTSVTTGVDSPPVNQLHIKEPVAIEQKNITGTLEIKDGSIIKGSIGQGANNYYRYTSTTTTASQLNAGFASVDLAQTAQFTLVTIDHYTPTESLKAGSTLKASGVKSPGYSFSQATDGAYTIKNQAGDLIDNNATFAVNRGEYITWSDNNTYQYNGTSNPKMKPGDISANNGNYSLSTSGLWNLVPVVAKDQSYTVTAVLKGDATTGDQVVIAEGRPHDIDASGATGDHYEVYKSATAIINGESKSEIDLIRNEIQLPQDANGTYPPINSGQLISYYVLPDQQKGINSAAIKGLQADREYYIIRRGQGRIALALTADDMLSNRAIDLTDYGIGTQHVFRYEVGQSQTLTLTTGNALTYTANAQQQTDKLTLKGNYNANDSISLCFKLEGALKDIPINYIVPKSGMKLSEIRDELLAKLNSTEGLCSGSGKCITVTADPLDSSSIFLSSLTPGKGYQLAGDASNSERAQVNTLTLGSDLVKGDTIKLIFDVTPTPLEVSYTVGSSKTTEIRDGLIATINEKIWKELGADRFVEAATNYDSATQQLQDNQILLKGTINGKKYTITQSYNQLENSNKLSLATGTEAFKDSDTSQDLELSSITPNQAATNQTNQTFSIKDDNRRYAANSVVSITSGLLQQSNNHLLGANIFLTSENEIIDASGNNATTPQTITTNQVVYVETTPADSCTGKYYTYEGNTETLTGAQLRKLLGDKSNPTLWQETNGKNYQLVAIGGTSDIYVLAGSNKGPNLLGANKYQH